MNISEFVDQIQTQVEAYNAFIDDMANCEKIVLTFDSGAAIYEELYFLLRACPLLVAQYIGGAWQFGDSRRENSVDWDNVPVVTLVYETDGDVTRNRYFISKYATKDYRHRAHYQTLDSDLTDREIWQKPPIAQYYHQVARDHPGARWQGAASPSGAWSESNWPESPGLATRYIDNVGVFCPDHLDIDFGASHKAGGDLLVLRIIRPPNVEAESTMRAANEVSSLLSFLTGGAGRAGSYLDSGEKGDPGAGAGAGIVQGIKNTIGYAGGIFSRQASYFRWCYPRIRAFGRQEGALMSYTAYVSKFNSTFGEQNFSVPNSNPVVHARLFWNNLHVMMLPQQAFNAFVEPLRQYVFTQQANK